MSAGLQQSPLGARRLSLGSTELWLLAERAVWWPGRSTLLVSDLHLGRPRDDQPGADAAAAGASRDLARLDALQASTGARSLIVLGDLRHAPAPHLAAAEAVLEDWAQARPEPALLLIRGNQDERTGDPPRDWGIETVDQGHRWGPLWLFHHPPEASAAARLGNEGPDAPPASWIAGHLHPGTGQRDEADRGRRTSPAFLLEGSGLVLPAFGEGTHAHPPRRRPRQRRLPIVDGQVQPPQ